MDHLTLPQQQRLRNLVRRSPAFIGMRIEMHDDHVEVLHPEPLLVTFASLSLVVADVPTGQWPDLVDQHLTRVLELGTSTPAELTGPTEEVLDRIYLRVMEDPGAAAPLPDYATELVPGVRVLFAFDLPDAIMTLTDEHVGRHGYERLHEAGMHNLTRQLPDRYAENKGVIVLQGSDYVGSLVLILPWVVEALTGLVDPPHGALVSMPARDTLVFHVVADRAGVDHAVAEIAEIAAEVYAASPFGISPRVYWCGPEPEYRLESIAHHDGTGLVTYYSDAFGDMLYDVDRAWD